MLKLSDGTTARTERRTLTFGGGAALLLSLALALAITGFASTAAALDDISIDAASAEAAAEGADACPALTRIKYPWSNCGEGFALGFSEGKYGEPPVSLCRLTASNGMCAATTEAWGERYLGLKRTIVP